MRGLNAPHKLALGFLDSSKVSEITSSGVYTLNRLNRPIPGIQVLKIKRPTSQRSDESYFLEYREAKGFDSTLPPAIINGVLIHLWDGKADHQTRLIDATPNTPTPRNGKLSENSDEALADGLVFHDEENNIKITQISHDNDKVMIRVDLGPPLPPPPPHHGVPFTAEYFKNENLSGSPSITKIEPILDFDWGRSFF